MKYFPLVWTALWRKPARTILTFLSAVAAFTVDWDALILARWMLA